jgi:hypothetical protein
MPTVLDNQLRPALRVKRTDLAQLRAKIDCSRRKILVELSLLEL